MKIYCHLYIPLLLLQAEADTPSNPIIKFLLEERAWLWPLLFTILTAVISGIAWYIKNKIKIEGSSNKTGNSIISVNSSDIAIPNSGSTVIVQSSAGAKINQGGMTSEMQMVFAKLLSENEELKKLKDQLKSNKDNEVHSKVLTHKEAIQQLLTEDESINLLKVEDLSSFVRANNSNTRAKLLSIAIENTEWLNKTEEIAKTKREQASKSYFQLAGLDEEELRYTDALIHYRKAVQLQPTNALFLTNFGNFLLTIGLYNEAIQILNNALNYLDVSNTQLKGSIKNNIGLAYYDKGEYDKAIEFYQTAIVIDKKINGEENPQISTYYNNIGAAYDNKGEYDKAIDFYQKSLVIDKTFSGVEHPKIATCYNNLGEAYRTKGEYNKAINYFQKALSIDKKFYDDEHPVIAIRYNNIGGTFDNIGEYDKAIDYYQKALVIGKKYHGEEHPYIASSYNNLGGAYKSKGEYDKAIDYYQKALVIDKKYHGEEHPDNATRYNNLGSAYDNKGEYDKAIDYYQKAFSIFIKFLGENHPSTITVKENLAAARKALAQSKK